MHIIRWYTHNKTVEYRIRSLELIKAKTFPTSFGCVSFQGVFQNSKFVKNYMTTNIFYFTVMSSVFLLYCDVISDVIILSLVTKMR